MALHHHAQHIREPSAITGAPPRDARGRPRRGSAARPGAGVAGTAGSRKRAQAGSRRAARRVAAGRTRAIHLSRSGPDTGHSYRHRHVALVAWPGTAARTARRSSRCGVAQDREMTAAMNAAPVTEADLHAYVDGALSPERASEIEAYLAQHPEDSARVAAYREQVQVLRRDFARVLEEPMPDRFRKAGRALRLARYVAGASA